MNPISDPGDLKTFELLMDIACESERDSGKRAEKLLRLLGREHGAWVPLIRRRATLDGLGHMIKRHDIRPIHYRKPDGSRATEPSKGRVRRLGEDGVEENLQLEFDLWTRSDVRESIGEVTKMHDKYGDKLAVRLRLDALFDAVPAAVNVGEARAALGVSIEQWLEMAA